MLESFLGYYVLFCLGMLPVMTATLFGGIWYYNKRTNERLRAYAIQTINELNK